MEPDAIDLNAEQSLGAGSHRIAMLTAPAARVKLRAASGRFRAASGQDRVSLSKALTRLTRRRLTGNSLPSRRASSVSPS
jgi:hypothetical protein